MLPGVIRNWDVMCLGEPLVEFSEETTGRYLRGFGGDASNVAIAVARSGGQAAIASRIGTDAFGEMFTDLWTVEGVDHSAVARDTSAPTGHYFRHNGAGAARLTYSRRGSAASLMRPGDLAAATVAAARVLHLSGTTCAISDSASALALEAVAMARSAGTRISFDLHVPVGQGPVDRSRSAALSILGQCDIALPNLADAERLLGVSDPEAIVDRVLGYGPQVVALTMGPEGVYVATTEARRRIAPLRVDVVDVSGAGDTFDGYFLSGLTAGDDLAEAAIRANAAAALSTTRRGAVTGIPSAAEVGASLG